MTRSSVAALFAITMFSTTPSAFANDDLQLSDLPKSVQKTIKDHVRDGKITEIEREGEENGKTVYEIEFERGGEGYEMEVTEDGTLLELED